MFNLTLHVTEIKACEIADDATKIGAVIKNAEGDHFTLGMTLDTVDRMIDNLTEARKLAEAKGAPPRESLLLRPVSVGVKVWRPEENPRFVALAMDPGTALASGFLLNPKTARDVGKNLLNEARSAGG